MKLKRATTAFLAACMAFSTFAAACGGDDSRDKDGAYILDYYFIHNGMETQTSVIDEVEDAINAIIKPKINAVVELHPVHAWNYDEKMNNIINAGDKFDICYTSSWTNNYTQKVMKEAYVDITEMLPEYAPTLYANVDPALYEAVKIDGKIYGAINLQILPRTPGMCVDKKEWDAFRKENPNFSEENVKSFGDIEPFLAFLKKKYPQSPYIMAAPDPAGLVVEGGFDELVGMTYPGAIQVADDPADGLTVVNQFATDFYKETFKTCVEFYKKGYFNQDQTFSYTEGYCWNLSTWKPGVDAEQTLVAGREMYCFPIGEAVMYNSWSKSNLNAISSTSEEPETALKFLELLNTDKDLYNLITFGIEGKHYNKVGENRIEVPVNTEYTMGNVGWQFSNQFNAYLQPEQEDDVWEETKTINASAEYSPLMGFSFDSSKVELELSNCYMAYLEYINSFIYGIFTKDGEFDKQYNNFMKKLKACDMQRVLEEMQKQIDAWLAANK